MWYISVLPDVFTDVVNGNPVQLQFHINTYKCGLHRDVSNSLLRGMEGFQGMRATEMDTSRFGEYVLLQIVF